MNLIIKYLIIVFFTLLALIINKLKAQIIIVSGPEPEQMIEKIIGTGVLYDNVTYQGGYLGTGTFNNGNSTILGLDSGIVFSSGKVIKIPGPSIGCGINGNLFTPGHPLFDDLSTEEYPSIDAVVLEFDFTPESDSIIFTYVFGSDGYSDFFEPYFLDAFACFITGPDPAGGNYENKNIAIVPGTPDSIISITNINNGESICGNVPTGPCVNCAYYKDNTSGETLEYDGLTTPLEANISVIPCETYHMVIGVADFGYNAIDAGAFIKESTYQSPQLEISLLSDTTFSDAMIEGCSAIDVIFKLPDVKYAPTTISLDMSAGTANSAAWPDGDFEEALPTELTFEEGQDSITLHIHPVKDGIIEGDEVLQIITEYSLTCPVYIDTIEIIISDYIAMATQTRPDTAICQGDDLELWVNVENGIPDYTFEWEGLPYTNDTITVNPNISTWYFVNVIDNCQDTVTDSIYVEVIPFPEVYLGNDTTICSGDEIILQAPSGNYTNYLWSTGDTSSSIIVADSGTYTLTVFNACGQAGDDVIVDQWPYPDPGLGPDLYLCYGETAVLNAAFGFVSYTWHDNSTDDYYIVTQSGIYTVTVEDIHGCTGSDTVFAVVGDIVQLEDSLVLCEGETTTIHANPGFNTYTWSTGQSGNDSIVVSEPGWYTVNVSYVFGCPSGDSAFVEALSVPTAEITGSDLLCEGDTLWLVAPYGKYAYYWNNEPGTDQLMISCGGTYNLKMVNACGEDEASKVVQLSPLPQVDLGEDRLLFPGESITLDAGNFQTFIWNNDPNENGQYYSVNYEDIDNKDSIRVEVFDGFCKNTDDMIIGVFNVKVPNVITPNGDGYNDLFRPIKGLTGITNHSIMVFNRWGEKIWESNDFASGWDGKNNGRLVANGTYFWILEVWYGKQDIKKVYRGSLTVLGEQ